jgi:DNA mismatch repair protein MutS2
MDSSTPAREARVPWLLAVPASSDSLAAPDLLHVVPRLRCDVSKTRLAVGLAFAGGLSGGLFDEALEGARLAASTYEPRVFADDLFLKTFVQQCFLMRVEGMNVVSATNRIVRLLGHPPADAAVLEFRRDILRELASSEASRASLTKLHALVSRFRTALEGATNEDKWDANRRQIDVLHMLKDIVDQAAEGFVDATSGLSRLREFGERVRGGEPYQSLADLLRYEENMATLSLKVGVGADGRIRGFEITSVEANAKNPFATSAWRRWMQKIELFARGYHFGDGEVMARLIDAVFDGVQDEVLRVVQLLGDLELYLGALAFEERAKSAGLSVCIPEIVDPESPCVLKGLFNPLLLGAVKRVVPCDVEIDRHDATVLVTGPNSGGKTRLLQSMGLVQMLAQAGMFVPAKEAKLALARGLVVSIVQETRANQTEGRLGMELVRIRELFERLLPGTVVILDELCSGTNPSEGEEIFELVVRMLRKLRPHAFISTHFLGFAARLEEEKKIEGLRFLQVELGADHEPTYQFVRGVAKTSLAGQTAARLGVTGEQLAQLVDRNVAQAKAEAPPTSTPVDEKG